MFGYDLDTLALISAAIFVGGVVKGISGFGLPVVTIAIVINFVPAPVALAIVVIPILVTNLWQAMRAGDLFAPLREYMPMIMTFVVTLVITAHFVVNIDEKALFGVIGVCFTIFTLSNMIRPPAKPLTPATRIWAAPLAGFFGGIIGGLSTIWGPPMMMYLVLLKLPKDTWVRVIGLVWFMGAVPLTLSYFANGILNSETTPLSLYACLPGMLGTLVGENIRKRIDQETFRKIILSALLLIGLNLIRRALF
jgi:uncharacterized membrane protein YfcA